jgi:hypothetical protein
VGEMSIKNNSLLLVFTIILAVCTFVSCQEHYSFEKINKNEILFRKDKIEGKIFQPRGFIYFDESNYKLLENYLNKFEAFFELLINNDKQNILINEWRINNKEREADLDLVLQKINESINTYVHHYEIAISENGDGLIEVAWLTRKMQKLLGRGSAFSYDEFTGSRGFGLIRFSLEIKNNEITKFQYLYCF